MKLKSIFFMTILLSSFSFARDGVNTGNGGGLSEMNMVSVWQSLEEYNQRVLKIPTLSQDDRNHLLTLNHNRKVEPENLVFTNPRTNPAVFTNPKMIFSTQATIGSKIYINQDQLYKVIDQEKVSLTLTDSYLLILEILNTRYNYELENIITLATNYLDAERTMVNLNSYGRRDIGLEVLEFGERKVILTAEENRKDITKQIIQEVGCSASSELKLSQLIFQDFGNLTQKTAEVYFYGEIEVLCDGQKVSGEIEILSLLELLNVSEDLNSSWVYNKKVKSKVKSAEVELYNLRIN